MQAFSAFNCIYNHTGLFGIQATTCRTEMTNPQQRSCTNLYSVYAVYTREYVSESSMFASKAIDSAVKELIAVATPGDVSQVQLDRAKTSTKSAILMNLESRIVASEDIGRQLLTYGERKPVEHFLKAIDEVTLKEISSLAAKLISSPLTMASYGDVLYLPSYEQVSRKFKSN